MIRPIIFGWLITIFFLFIYSFTQIDLGLTLTRVSWWQNIQRSFQRIGYFNRPLSTGLYLAILFLLFSFYFLLLWLIKKEKLSLKVFKTLIVSTVGISLLSYPAFSHDIFNYLFDAKTIVVYRQNPYQVKPLDFVGDPMLGFMHWTHRPSIFPPFWLGISLLPFYLGFGKLILQIVFFKAMIAIFYLGTIWLIWKISEILKTKNKLLKVALFAFNPLVVIENLVSAHNDGAMIFFVLLAFYFLLKKKYLSSFFSWFFSIGLKYSSVILLPVFGMSLIARLKEKKIEKRILLKTAAVLMFLAVVLVSNFYLGFQPWYLLWVFPFIFLFSFDEFFPQLAVFLSVGALLRYAPFLYLGNWDPPVPTINFWLLILSGSAGSIWFFLKNYVKR